MARRVELGAGLAAAVLSVLTLAILLIAPIVPTCSAPVVAGRCPGTLRYLTLAQAGRQVDASVWLYIIIMAVVTLAGAVGAVLHAVRGWRRGVWLLWPAALLTFAACAIVGAQGGALGLYFLPPTFSLALAAAAAFAARQGWARRAPAAEGGQPPGEPGPAG